MRRLIQFRPGVFARVGEVVTTGTERWELRLMRGVPVWVGHHFGHRDTPPELRTFPTTTTEQQRPLYRGWDWEA